MRTSIRASRILAAVCGQTASKRLMILTLPPEDTGLPMTVYVPTRDPSRYRAPQVKVSREHGQKSDLNRLVDVSISDNPSIIGAAGLSKDDLRLVRAWVLLNRDILLRCWNRALSTTDMLAALRPLGQPRGRKWALGRDF